MPNAWLLISAVFCLLVILALGAKLVLDAVVAAELCAKEKRP